MEEPLLIDLVNGRIGSFVRQETMPGNPNAVKIFYKPLGKNPFVREEKILNVPIAGIIDVTKVETPYSWKIIVSDGNTTSPPLVFQQLSLKYTELVNQVNDMMSELSTQRSVLKTKESELLRSKDDVVNKEVRKIMSSKTKRKTGRFSELSSIGTEEI